MDAEIILSMMDAMNVLSCVADSTAPCASCATLNKLAAVSRSMASESGSINTLRIQSRIQYQKVQSNAITCANVVSNQ